MVGAGAPVADHSKGPHLPTDWRDRGRRDNVATRAARWAAQLGLPLLLASRCDLHSAGADEWWLLRGGKGLESVAASYRRGRPVAGSDHVRTCRGTSFDRVGGAVASRL